MKKPNPYLARFFEIQAQMTMERWEHNLLQEERRFFDTFKDKYPDKDLLTPLPLSPMRQEAIIKYRDYVGWVPFMKEVQEASVVFPYFIKMINGAKKSLKITRKNFKIKTEATPTSKQVWKDFETYAHGVGIDLIGYTQVDNSFIFQNKGLLYPNIIVLIMRTDFDAIAQSPSFPGCRETMRVYADLTKSSNLLARYLQKQGFRAQPVIPYGGQILFPLIAAKAGLGYPGYHGLLITKEFGPGIRIAAITTDADTLPETRPNPMADIRDFCKTCKACIKRCLGKAIYEEPVRREDSPIVTHMNKEKCYPYVARFKHCSVCLKVCTEKLMEHKQITLNYKN